jgi:hypothetical protein
MRGGKKGKERGIHVKETNEEREDGEGKINLLL